MLVAAEVKIESEEEGSSREQEFEEILGYHLEQAHRYLRELGPLDEAGVAIGVDAARRLSSAAKRAFARGDMHAAADLTGQADHLGVTIQAGTLQYNSL